MEILVLGLKTNSMKLKKSLTISLCLSLFISCDKELPETDIISEVRTKKNKNHSPVNFQYKSTIKVGGEGASEIAAFDTRNHKLFVVNVESAEISVFDITDLENPVQKPSIPIHSGAPNSVAVHGGKLAVAIENQNKQANGWIVIYDTDDYSVLGNYQVGALPDMVTFSPNGQYVISANEGEPGADYLIDPKGSVSIVKLSTGELITLTFDAFEAEKDHLLSNGFRVFGPGATLAEDIEPEYITVSDDSRTAWVTLQENNGIAKINLISQQIEAIFPLGFKEYFIPGNELDASDKDHVKMLRSWPVYGIYQPDAIDYVKIGGVDYIITANEGDAREYEGIPGFIEEERIEDIDLDPLVFPNAAELKKKTNLGRLKITTTLGDTDMDGDFDALYSYGARSFSIWSGEDGALVYDSGNAIAEKTLNLTPERFNDNDKRSDDKGAEPESVEVLRTSGNQHVLFVGLERNDQILVYDITNPVSPQFIQILQHQDDEAPEGLLAVEAKDSPSKKDILIVSNEDSGTVTIYENQ